jgi:Trk K+ transport system NAD-binding subunit
VTRRQYLRAMAGSLEEREPAPGAGDALNIFPAVAPEGCRDWRGHVIVCGIVAVTVRAVEQMLAAGAQVVVLEDEYAKERDLLALRRLHVPVIARGARTGDSLTEAGIAGALAVVCIEASDLRTLETALLVRGLRADVRVVAQLDNPAIARAMEEVSGEATVLDVASLFAPSVVEACVKRRAHDITLSGTHFVTVEVVAPGEDTLRALYGSLVPLGVSRDREDQPIVCPGRDLRVSAGDRITLLGTREEVEEAGLGSARLAAAGEIRRRRMRLTGRVSRAFDLLAKEDRALRTALCVFVALVVASTLVLHFGYRRAGGLSVLSGLYFTIETISTVGFGDFSFSHEPVAIEIFGIALIVAGTTLISTIFALLTNALVSRRIAQQLGQADIPGMRGHVVMVGLGAVGMKVLEGLLERGRSVVVVERDEGNPYVNQVRQRGVPLVLGDATLGQTLDSVNLAQASSVAIVTSSDMANIETGLAVRDRLGERWESVPVVLRVLEQDLGVHLQHSFGFRQVWSTLAIAAPWFAGAALGMDVLYSFYVGNHPFLLARLPISDSGGLKGLAMSELGVTVRVIALDHADGSLEHPPRRDTRFRGGESAYLAGPYEELMTLLARERAGGRAD